MNVVRLPRAVDHLGPGVVLYCTLGRADLAGRESPAARFDRRP